MSEAAQRSEFSVLRMDYYTSGRLLLLGSCLHGAGIMLGYAIEHSCKAALNHIAVKDHSLLYSHELAALLSACRNLAIFTSLAVSDEFIDYANDRLNQRYPSQQAKVLNRTAQKNRIVLIGVQDLEAYDDLLIQMDDELVRLTGDEFVSVGVRNAASADTYASRTFFHCNGPAILHLNKYLEIVKRLRPDNTEAISELEKGPDYLWNFAYMPQYVCRNLNVDSNTHPAASFKYPTFNTNAG